MMAHRFIVVESRLILRAFGLLGLVLALFGSFTPADAESSFGVLPDYPVANGHFYTQASGGGSTVGYPIVDDASAKFYSEFNRLGGVGALGYPSSGRFVLGGFLTQATQKYLLQWRPELQQSEPANVFDIFTERGLDPVLAKNDLIPPTPDNLADHGLTWPRVVARHLAILDGNPTIKARYLADPNWMFDYGLPQSAADYGGVYVVRCERAAFQFWRFATPFADPGTVTVVNAGDLAKQLGIIPATAAAPVPAASQIVTPPGTGLTLDSGKTAAVRAAADAARPSLVRIDVTVPGGAGVGSGIVMNARGDILTAEHVIDGAQSVRVTFGDGAAVPAHIVGVDVPDDVAVLAVPIDGVGTDLKTPHFGTGADLDPGQLVVALGYTPYFPSPPTTRLGVFQSVEVTGENILQTDTFILPGDSGGMLLDTGGTVVGMNDAIRFTNNAKQPLIGFSIDAADALRAAQRILQGAGAPAG
jgi:hypothetical protein